MEDSPPRANEAPRFARSTASARHRVLSVLFVVALTLLALTGTTSAAGPGDPTKARGDKRAFVREVRVLEAKETGIVPAGLAFSARAGAFYLAAEGRARGATAIATVTPRGARRAKKRLPTRIGDPVNIAYDLGRRRVLALASPASLLEVPETAKGLDPAHAVRVHVGRLGIRDPRGIAVDRRTSRLFVLDATGPRIVRVDRKAGGGYASGAVSAADVDLPAGTIVRGLAFDPSSGHLHVLAPHKRLLYELTQAGSLVAERDLRGLGFRRPQALAVAPTGDLTDGPARLGVYVADAGRGIAELSFLAPVGFAATSFTSSLVKTTNAALWTPPSPDSSGIAYVPSTGRLIVVDGEVEEAPRGITHFRGANVWETTLGGSVVRSTNVSTLSPRIAPFSDEPVGVAWNSTNGHYYISDDDQRRVFDVNPGGDGLFGTTDDTWTSFGTSAVGNDDPEGIAYDSRRNRIIVADGVNAEIYEYTTTGSVVAHFDVARYGVSDPESVEFNRDSGTLLVLSHSNDVIVETGTDGALRQTINISASPAKSPAGLAHGPASDGSGARRFYIVDRGVDNDSDPRSIDGKLYELTAPAGPTTPGNLPPTVDAGPNRTVELPNAVVLDGTVTDDGLPNPPGKTTTTWSKVSGPGSVTFADPSAVDTTATISSIGTYVLRLTATDGELSSSRDMTVTATGAGGAASLDVRVSAAGDDAEESASGSVSLSSSDLELVFDGSNQVVGVRFTGISIPPATAIKDAYVQFTADEVTTGAVALSIAGVDTDNASTFTTATANVSSRPRTAASVAWSPPDWPTIGAAGDAQRTPNLAPIIQEIVDRPGWASGNSLALVVTGTGRRAADSFDGSSAAAPLLHVEYGGTTPGNTAPSVTITAPQSGATVGQGTAVGFAGSASDTQDGDLSASLAWSSSIDGQIGAGGSFTTSTLSLGTHTITARATDGGGLTGTAQITLTVTSTNTAPSVAITAPPDGAEVEVGTAVTFAGSSSDTQDGDLSASLAWSSSIDGAIGTGTTFTTSTLSVGTHTITAKATDSGGLTGSAQVRLIVTSPDFIFADGFESGDLSRWSSSATGSGDLAVTAGAALAGAFGLRALVNDNTSLYARDDTPAAERRYRARFAFDPNSIAMGTSDVHSIFTGRTASGATAVRIELRRSSGIYQVRARCLNDAGSLTSTTWATIPDAPLTIEIDWKAATAAGAADGSVALWINGVSSGSASGIDNDTHRVDSVRLGAASGIDTGTRGTYYFDNFESRRQTFIGP